MKTTVADIQARMGRELSLRSRMMHALLLLVSLSAAATIASLWLTEPYLPVRTHLGFALIVAINLAWTAHASRVLLRRRVLFAIHRVAIGRMAIGFGALFLVGAFVASRSGAMPRAGDAVVAFGAVMLLVAVVLLIRARQQISRLEGRRRELERELQLTRSAK